MTSILTGITQGVERWSRADQWPIPSQILNRATRPVAWVGSFFPMHWLEQSGRANGNFWFAHVAQSLRLPHTLNVAGEALRACGKEVYLPGHARTGLLIATPFLFFVPRGWRVSGFLRDHLSEIGLVVQTVAAVALYQKGKIAVAVAVGLLVAERTVEYFGLIPTKWQTTFNVVRFFSPQLLAFFLPLANYKANPKLAAEIVLKASVVGLAIVLVRKIYDSLLPQHRFTAEQAYRIKSERLNINTDLDLNRKSKSVKGELEAWFYPELRARYVASVEDKGYWGTQFYGTKAERQALWARSSIPEAREVLEDVPGELRRDWMRKRFGGRTEIPLHAFFKPRQELMKSGSVSRSVARQLEAVEAAFDQVGGALTTTDWQNPSQKRVGEEFPKFLEPILSLYLSEIGSFMTRTPKHGIDLANVLKAPTKEAMFARVKTIYEEHVPSAAAWGKYFELETQLLHSAGARWETHVPEASDLGLDVGEDWLQERTAKQKEMTIALMLMDLDFARQG